MKLPDIAYDRPVESFGRRSPYLPLAEASVDVSIATAVSDMAQATGEVAEDIYDRQTKIEINKARRDYLDGEKSIVEQYGLKRQYSNDELPENLRNPKGRARPAYEVKASLLQQIV